MSEAWLPQVNVLRDGGWIVDGSPHGGSSWQLAADITCTFRGFPTHNSALHTSSFRTRRSYITITNTNGQGNE